MYLGLDLGRPERQSGHRGRDGQIAAGGSAPVERFCGGDGGVEQDIEQIWAAACDAIRQAAGAVDGAIRAVGVSSQGGAMQLLDGHEQPIGRVVSWLDGAAGPSTWN